MAEDINLDDPKIKAAIDAAVEAAVEPLKAKNAEILSEKKEAERKLRAASEITPDTLAAAEDRADKAEARAAELDKQLKATNKALETATKSLEAEQGAARNFALEAELASAIAEGNVLPGLVPGFKALMVQQAKAELVDGKYQVMIGDKPARDHIKAFLDSDDGKTYRAAPINGGGGAPGSRGGGENKTVTREQFDAMTHVERATFSKDGGKVVDQAA